MNTCFYVYVCMYLSMYAPTYVRMYVCMNLYIRVDYVEKELGKLGIVL